MSSSAPPAFTRRCGAPSRPTPAPAGTWNSTTRARARRCASTACVCSSNAACWRGKKSSNEARAAMSALRAFRRARKSRCGRLTRTTLELRRFRHTLEVVEGKKPARMSVAPHRLDRVAADRLDAPQLKRRRRQPLVRSLVKLAEDVHLALAAGARAGAAQFFQRHETLAAVVPPNCQF